MRRLLTADGLSRPVGEYSHAVSSGSTLFIGAKGATRPEGKVPLIDDYATSVEQQCTLTLRNIDYVLDQYGTDRSRALQSTVFVTDWRFRPAVEQAVRDYFGEDAPPQTYLFSPAFALPELLFEIDMVASLDRVPTRLTDDGGAILAQAGDWYYSSGVVAGESHAQCRDEIVDLAGRLDSLLAGAGLGREHLLHARARLNDARHLGTVREWWDTWPGVPPALTLTVGLGTSANRRLTIDVTACAKPPEKITMGDVGWGDGPFQNGTAGAYAAGVLQTSAVSGPQSPGNGSEAPDIVRRLQQVATIAGMSVEDVVKVDGVLSDWQGYGAFKRRYSEAMSPPYPTRSLTQAWPSQLDAALQLSWTAFEGARDDALVLVPPGADV